MRLIERFTLLKTLQPKELKNETFKNSKKNRDSDVLNFYQIYAISYIFEAVEETCPSCNRRNELP